LRAAQGFAHLRIAAAIAVCVARCRYRLRGLAWPDGTFTRRTTFRVSVLHPFLLSVLHVLVAPHVGPASSIALEPLLRAALRLLHRPA
jgi:hypothetical protein